MEQTPAPFREWAGVLIAVLIVVAYIMIGFVQIVATIILGVEIKVPGDWMASMLSLASAAVGFLMGKPEAMGRTIDSVASVLMRATNSSDDRGPSPPKK